MCRNLWLAAGDEPDLQVHRRLSELRPAFERFGCGHWLDYSLRALDHLAGNASGTRNLIAETFLAQSRKDRD
ncbi:hypothetical protein [Nonomuraea antri]|uniref:hypothetical protein n=1 Tax=Nonomuraea antri TaxID=2730852 RepID=UPI001568F0C0|nr:hypothetical protein [Nonomuraea antri]